MPGFHLCSLLPGPSHLRLHIQPRPPASCRECPRPHSFGTRFVTAFSSVAPLHTVLRIWDWYLHHGSMVGWQDRASCPRRPRLQLVEWVFPQCSRARFSQVLFMVSLAMLTLRLDVILALEDSSAIFNALADTPASMTDSDRLMTLRWVRQARITERLKPHPIRRPQFKVSHSKDQRSPFLPSSLPLPLTLAFPPFGSVIPFCTSKPKSSRFANSIASNTRISMKPFNCESLNANGRQGVFPAKL